MSFKIEVCTCSQFPIDSMDDVRSSSSVRGIRMPDLKYSMRRLLQHWTESSIILKRRISLEERKTQKQDRFLPRKTDCLPDLWVLPSHRSQRYCRELCRPAYWWSPKWWFLGIRYKTGRNFINNDKDSTWRYLARIVQIKNTRVW